jgi:SAM-dependent MidA family methyltransferase
VSDNAKEAKACLQAMIEEAGGFLPLDRFMEEALYHPRYGYYSASITQVGPEGDFSTAATISPLLARSIAHWASERRREFKWGFRWNLIEVGGGNGLLAASILRELPWRDRMGCRYHFVEVSPRLRKIQQKTTGRVAAHWHDSVQEALEHCGGQALIVSNELMDAFPIVGLIKEDGEWRELGVGWEEGAAVECSRWPRSQRAQLALEEMGEYLDPIKEGGRLEVPLSIRDWMMDWVDSFQLGSILTIDYGNSVDDHLRQYPFGSLRAYFRHHALEGPEVYRRFGQQDLTTDVNFTLLEKWARECGMRAVGLTTQREFITRRAKRGMVLRARDNLILDEFGAGTAFKVAEWVAPDDGERG